MSEKSPKQIALLIIMDKINRKNISHEIKRSGHTREEVMGAYEFMFTLLSDK